MSLDPLTAAFDLGKIAIEKIWPNPTERAEQLLKLETLKQNGDLAALNAHVQLMLGQIEINKIEAASTSLFVAGGRPAIIWVGAIALALVYWPKAIVLTIMWGKAAAASIALGVSTLPPYPDLGVTDLIGLVSSLLGVGAMRSVDKFFGTQTDSVTKK